MSNERKPLLTEEQIHSTECQCKYPLPDSWYQTYCAKCGYDLPKQMNTTRVLNLARLRADVKAWVDDPNRKYPKWMMKLVDKTEMESIALSYDELTSDEIELCCFSASIIGINPDNYFEEVEVTE